jgi:hypothetical protein
MIEYYLYKTYAVVYSADKNPRDIYQKMLIYCF